MVRRTIGFIAFGAACFWAGNQFAYHRDEQSWEAVVSLFVVAIGAGLLVLCIRKPNPLTVIVGALLSGAGVYLLRDVEPNITGNTVGWTLLALWVVTNLWVVVCANERYFDAMRRRFRHSPSANRRYAAPDPSTRVTGVHSAS